MLGASSDPGIVQFNSSSNRRLVWLIWPTALRVVYPLDKT